MQQTIDSETDGQAADPSEEPHFAEANLKPSDSIEVAGQESDPDNVVA